eukprot:CAMPEP_0113415798 /NCGR_PEP_ID=MMETSP0013_2-20120614/24771_1 /TAXON_ID=2843 ORGANISM="Skeletonema costatum, Strain 1716" /NCGR_SAMPLE_ID=MMETSP0013_2 /ASSEMBLY_ACC=CAM_ASM_000158 /LENGTH=157 /DNA_ID=CAMNT_0000302803 /DNA_START=1 /DNA_END=474 /DNA_ORIENTATION=+ /assembly_acc=CAM_ASM_000158
MFWEASSFNQNLCSWKDNFPYDNADVIFSCSGCTYQGEPQVEQQGPFCDSSCTNNGSTSTTSTSKLGEWQQCSNSKQCNNQCCSGKYSDGVLNCTPVGGFKPSEGCVGSATRRLRGNNEAEVLTADETNTNFMHYAAPVSAPVEELGRDVEYGDELN